MHVHALVVVNGLRPKFIAKLDYHRFRLVLLRPGSKTVNLYSAIYLLSGGGEDVYQYYNVEAPWLREILQSPGSSYRDIAKLFHASVRDPTTNEVLVPKSVGAKNCDWDVQYLALKSPKPDEPVSCVSVTALREIINGNEETCDLILRQAVAADEPIVASLTALEIGQVPTTVRFLNSKEAAALVRDLASIQEPAIGALGESTVGRVEQAATVDQHVGQGDGAGPSGTACTMPAAIGSTAPSAMQQGCHESLMDRGAERAAAAPQLRVCVNSDDGTYGQEQTRVSGVANCTERADAGMAALKARYEQCWAEVVQPLGQAGAAPSGHALLCATHDVVTQCLAKAYGGKVSFEFTDFRVTGIGGKQIGHGSYNELWPAENERAQPLVVRLPQLRRSSYGSSRWVIWEFMAYAGPKLSNMLYASKHGGERVLGFLPVRPAADQSSWQLLQGRELYDALQSGDFIVATLHERRVDVPSGAEVLKKRVGPWAALTTSFSAITVAARDLAAHGAYHPDLKPNNVLLTGVERVVEAHALGGLREALRGVGGVTCGHDHTGPASSGVVADNQAAQAFRVLESHAGPEHYSTPEQVMVAHAARSCRSLVVELAQGSSDIVPQWRVHGKRIALDVNLGCVLPAELAQLLAGAGHPVASRRLQLSDFAEKMLAMWKGFAARLAHCDPGQGGDRPFFFDRVPSAPDRSITAVLLDASKQLHHALEEGDERGIAHARHRVSVAHVSAAYALLQLAKQSWRRSRMEGRLMRFLRIAIATEFTGPGGQPHNEVYRSCDTQGRNLLHLLLATGQADAVRTALQFGSECGLQRHIDQALARQDENGDTPLELALQLFQVAAANEVLLYVKGRVEGTNGEPCDPPDWLYPQVLLLLSRMPLAGPAEEWQQKYDAARGWAYAHLAPRPPWLAIRDAVAAQLGRELAEAGVAVTALLRRMGATVAADALAAYGDAEPLHDVNGDDGADLEGAGAEVARAGSVVRTLFEINGINKSRLFSCKAGEDTPLHLQAALGCGEGLQLLCELGGDAAEACVGRTNADGRTPHQEARWCNPWLTTKAGGKLLRLSVRVDEYNDPVREPNVWDSAAGLRRWLRAVQGCADAELEELVEAVIAGREQGQ